MSRDVDRGRTSGGSPALSLAERMGRRGFIGKLAVAAIGLATALSGRPQSVQAVAGLVSVACCSLCHGSSSCTGRCCWTWTCCGASGTKMHLCKECYSTASCGPTCPSNCSQAIGTNVVCA